MMFNCDKYKLELLFMHIHVHIFMNIHLESQVKAHLNSKLIWCGEDSEFTNVLLGKGQLGRGYP